jgi:hypothetical protein
MNLQLVDFGHGTRDRASDSIRLAGGGPAIEFGCDNEPLFFIHNDTECHRAPQSYRRITPLNGHFNVTWIVVPPRDDHMADDFT